MISPREREDTVAAAVMILGVMMTGATRQEVSQMGAGKEGELTV